MKLPPPDIEASAQGMMHVFGDRAARHARDTATRCAKRRDAEGENTWLAIAAAIDAMQPPQPSLAETAVPRVAAFLALVPN